MARIVRFVKDKLESVIDWLVDHPRTIAWIVFWLGMNYVLDLLFYLF